MSGRIDTSSKLDNLQLQNRLTTVGVNVSCVVTPGYRVNIRTKPSVNADIIAQVENTEPLGLAIYLAKDDQGGFWLKLKNGGYIFANNTTEVDKPNLTKDQVKNYSKITSSQYINNEARLTKYLLTTKKVLDQNPSLKDKYAKDYEYLVRRNLYRTGSLINENKDLFKTKTAQLKDSGLGALPVVAIWIIVAIVISVGITAYLCLTAFNSQAKGDALKLTDLMDAITKDLSPEDKKVVEKALKQNQAQVDKVLQENADQNRSQGQTEGKESQFWKDWGGVLKTGGLILGGFWLANKFIINPKPQTAQN